MATRTKSYADRIKAKEAELLVKIEAERPKPGDREAAEAAHLAARDEMEAASEAVEEFHSTWRQTSGNEGPAVEDYILAQAILARATERRDAAKARLEGVKRRMSRNHADETDLTLANLVAEVVRGSLPGIEVIPTFLPTHDDPVKAGDPFPCAVVTVKKSERTRDGESQGEVTIDFYRASETQSPLSVRSLRDVTPGILGGRGSIYWPNNLRLHRCRTLSSRVVCDSITVRARGYGGSPVVPELGEAPEITRLLANSLARGLADIVESPIAPNPREPHFSSRAFRVASHSQRTLSAEVVNGERSAIIEAVVLVEQTRQTDRNVASQIAASMNYLEGQTVDDYGLIEKVERVDGEIDHRTAASFLRSRVPGRSEAKPGFETIAEVRVRCLVTSAVS